MAPLFPIARTISIDVRSQLRYGVEIENRYRTIQNPRPLSWEKNMRFFMVIACTITAQSAFGQDFRPLSPTNVLPPANAIRPNIATPTPYAPQWQSAGPVPTFNIAQPSWGPYGAGNITMIDYLRSDYMRKQVDFSDDQNDEFMNLQTEYMQELQSTSKKYPELYKRDLPVEDRKVILKKLQAEQTKLRSQFSKQAEELLVPHQVSIIKSMRFKQSVQMKGLTQTITNAPFQEDFGTTGKQKKELEKIRGEAQKAIQQKMLEMQKEVEKMRADAKKRMLRLLTEKQKKLLSELEDKKDSKNGNRNTRL